MKSFSVRRPASPEEEEDSSFERKDHLAITSEQSKENDKNVSQNESKEVSPKRTSTTKKQVSFSQIRNKNSFLGSKVVCHVRGKRQNLKGILRWQGYLPTLPKTRENIVVGIELTTPDKLGTDGSFMGKRYFQAPPKRGYFVKYKDCRRIK